MNNRTCCPACKGTKEQVVSAFINRGGDITTHTIEELTLTCEVCRGEGTVDAHVSMRYKEGAEHRRARIRRKETLFECAHRLGVTSAQLSAWEHGKADLPDTERRPSTTAEEKAK